MEIQNKNKNNKEEGYRYKNLVIWSKNRYLSVNGSTKETKFKLK